MLLGGGQGWSVLWPTPLPGWVHGQVAGILSRWTGTRKAWLRSALQQVERASFYLTYIPRVCFHQIPVDAGEAAKEPGLWNVPGLSNICGRLHVLRWKPLTLVTLLKECHIRKTTHASSKRKTIARSDLRAHSNF
jgi:hypothetical protein